jgi:hypothetical protein
MLRKPRREFDMSYKTVARAVLVIVMSSSLLTPISASAGFQSLPLDKSDNQSPALIAATLEKVTAPANSEDAIILSIMDDKNGMRVGNYEMSAPEGTGTLYFSEGYSQLTSVPELLSQEISPSGIKQTWKIKFKVPSVLGNWNGYRVDFSDLANNSVQFIIKDHSACANSKRYKYPNQNSGSLDAIPCNFALDLKVTPEDSGNIAKVTSSELDSATAALNQAKLDLKEAISKLQNLPINKSKVISSKSYDYFLNYSISEIKPGMEVTFLLPAAVKSIIGISNQIQGFVATLSKQYESDAKKPLPITCIKSGKKVVVSGPKPVCPKGYKLVR